MARIVSALVLVVMLSAPAHAQLVVTDPGNLAQATLIAERDSVKKKTRNQRAELMSILEKKSILSLL